MFGWFGRRKIDAVEELAQFLGTSRPGWRTLGVENGMLRIELEGGREPVQINVDRIRQTVAACAGSAQARQDVYAQWRATIDEILERDRPLSAEKDAKRLRPRIVPADYYQMLKKGPSPTARALPELGLWIVYALDSANSVSFLSEKQQAELGFDQDQVHETALDNLRDNRFRDIVQKLLRDHSAASVKMMDSYDAARLLLVPECLGPEDSLAACIPDRDTLFLCPLPATAGAALPDKIVKGLEGVAKAPASDRLILARPVRVTQNRFELL